VQKLLFSAATLGSMLNLSDAKHRATKLAVTACLLVLTIMAVLFVSTGINNALSPTGSHDFQWTPSKDVLDGVDPYQDFMQWKQAGNESVPPHFLNQSPSYPASTYILLAPWAHLTWEEAKLAWLIANLAFAVLLLLGMQKVFPIKNSTVLALVVLSFLIASPLRTSLGAGQHNLLSLAAFIWAYHFAFNRNNATLSGILLSLAWIKYSLTFPLTLLFIRRGNYKPILLAAIIHAILTCVAAWRINQLPHEFFFNSVEVVLMGDGTGFLNLIALSMNLNLPLPVPLTIIALTTFAVALMLWHCKHADDLVVLAFLGLFSCAVFYHHGYDFVVLIACAWALATKKLDGINAISVACLLSVAWVGQWLAMELTPVTGDLLAHVVNYFMVSIFYCTLFFFMRAILEHRIALTTATVTF